MVEFLDNKIKLFTEAEIYVLAGALSEIWKIDKPLDELIEDAQNAMMIALNTNVDDISV